MVFPIGIIQISTPRKWRFLHYFSSLHHYWPPTTLISLVHNSFGKMDQCETRAFQLLKIRKEIISWNIKTKCVTNFILTVRSSSMKYYTCPYVVNKKRQKFTLISIKKMWILKFFLHVTGYLYTKKSFPICMFVVKTSENVSFINISLFYNNSNLHT